MSKNKISVETNIDADIEKVWEFWTEPDHIVKWNNASDEWHTPDAKNSLEEGGKFIYRMEAKDGSAGFDFIGVYKGIKDKEMIDYDLEDGRNVIVYFEKSDGKVKVKEDFEPEEINPKDMQKEGWQAILNNFKKYVEEN